MECSLEYKDSPPIAAYESQYDFIIQKLKVRPADATQSNPAEFYNVEAIPEPEL